MADALSIAKAEAVLARSDGDARVIGSDRGELDAGRWATRPPCRRGAQLRSMSGARCVLTALCIPPDGRRLRALDVTKVRFRTLASMRSNVMSPASTLDCAGSFKCEGLGIALFDEIDNRDPTALIGLPLIATARLLREAGFVVP